MPPVADIAGFAEAQGRLRNDFAEEVTFFPRETFVYPPGTPIDPETDEPYDPTVEPISASAASAVVRCNVAFNTRGDEAQEGAGGLFEQTHVMLIADIAAASAIAPAFEFDVRGARYKIEAQKPDGIGGLQRYLVWGRQR